MSIVAAAAAAVHASAAPAGRVLAVEEGVLELTQPFPLFHGGSLPHVRIAWRLAGAPGSPVVAALGGISAHRRVFSIDGGDRHGNAHGNGNGNGNGNNDGWWDAVTGPGRALDSRRCRVLGFDFLGGSGETTGPTAANDFPSISTFDQAEVLAGLLNHLGIESLHAIVGASYGGMVGLAYAQRFPLGVQRLLVVSASHRAHPMATAWRSIQRAIVRRAIADGNGAAGLEIARALAMATYRSAEEFGSRFAAQPLQLADGTFDFPVSQYLFARGAAYAATYSPRAFLCLSESIDLHSVDASVLRTPILAVAIQQDQLVPVADLRALAASAPRARLIELSSRFGHDAFLKEAAQLAPLFSSFLFDEEPETSRE